MGHARKSSFKKRISAFINIDPKLLPYNRKLVVFLESQKLLNKRLVLCTGADIKFAQDINRYLCLFDEVVGSNGTINLVGCNKRDYLVGRFGKKGYDYIGNSYSDLCVWECAKNGIIVSDSNDLIKKASSKCNMAIFDGEYKFKSKAILNLIRTHQWLKNLLVFVPLITAPSLPNGLDLLYLGAAFLSFSMCASSVYILNDICDLENDRAHKTKCTRALASGDISIANGVIIALFLLISSIAISISISYQYTALIIIYFLLTITYSIYIKKNCST